MGFIGIFLLWYFLGARNNRNVYKKIENFLPKLIGFIILFGAGSSLIPGVLVISFVILGLVIALGLPIFAVALALRCIFGAKSIEQPSAPSTVRRVTPQDYAVNSVTKSVPKRKKIIKKFNEKYDLNLTEQEIERIIDASYVSPFWASEVGAMDRDYQTLSEWYRGSTGWFRVYIRSFPVQSISSDADMQMAHCLQTFNEVFDEVERGQYANIDECIKAINNRFLTNFDEAGFMAAYRFVEANGRKIELPGAKIIRNNSYIENLQKKYDDMENAKVRMR